MGERAAEKQRGLSGKNTFLQGKIKKLEIRQVHSVRTAVSICHFGLLGLGYQRGLQVPGGV